MPAQAHKTTIEARLRDSYMPTSTVLWSAQQTLECAVCEQPIPRGDLFTRAKVSGMGHGNVDQCRLCRPFTIKDAG